MQNESKFSFLNNAFKLEITFLIDLVAIAGFFTISHPLLHIILLVPLIFSGTLASMAAGIFNNLYDIDIDSKMQRVSSRRSFVSRERRGLITTMIIFLILSSLIAIIFLNIYTLIFIMLGFVSYAILYTIYLKRRTDLNIVIGGIAGSFPALAGGSVINGIPTISSIFVAVIVFLWTPTHFWSLAIKYTDDYKAANIPMLPATRGIESTRFWILINSSILLIFMSIPVFYPLIERGFLFRVLTIPMALILMIPSVVYYLKKGGEKQYRKLFSASNTFLSLALIVIVLSALT